MFDIGWSELLVIAIVAIVVVGPKDLPRMMRTFGHYAGKLRRAASDFQRQFEDAMRETELEEMRKTWEETQAGLQAPVDKPLMISQAKPEQVTAAIEAAEPAKPKAKPKPKRAAAKAKAPAAGEGEAPPKRAPRKRKAKPEVPASGTEPKA